MSGQPIGWPKGEREREQRPGGGCTCAPLPRRRKNFHQPLQMDLTGELSLSPWSSLSISSPSLALSTSSTHISRASSRPAAASSDWPPLVSQFRSSANLLAPNSKPFFAPTHHTHASSHLLRPPEERAANLGAFAAAAAAGGACNRLSCPPARGALARAQRRRRRRRSL